MVNVTYGIHTIVYSGVDKLNFVGRGIAIEIPVKPLPSCINIFHKDYMRTFKTHKQTLSLKQFVKRSKKCRS